MAVVLADRALTVHVKRHPWVRDAHGTPVPGPEVEDETRGPFPGAASEQPDGTWKLRLSPEVWPVQAGDRATDGDKTWVLTGDPKHHQVPGVSDVDYVAATGQLDPPEVP